MVVLVTSSAGNPVPYSQVTWTVTGGGYFMQNGTSSNSITTTTDSTGKTSATLFQPSATESVSSFGLVSTVVAVAGSAASSNAPSATFYESQAAPAAMQGLGYPDVAPNYGSAPLTTTITGLENAAWTVANGGPSFPVSVLTVGGTPVPNVALFILNSDNTVGPSTVVPSAYCVGQAGAGNYTVLTGTNGAANCTVMFGPVAGSGTYQVVLGGAQPTPGILPDANWISGQWLLDVTAPAVGSVKMVSGSPQTALAGSTLQPLVAEVLDTTANPLVGQAVTWSASPAGAITLTGATTTSTTGGLVEVATPVLSTLASGTITVTATSNTKTSAAATFTITATPIITVSSFTMLSSNETNQVAYEGAGFANQLGVVVIGSNSLPLSGVTVSFAVSGPVVLSQYVVPTNSNGVAQVAATAASNASGVATVTASITGFSQVFTLTVLKLAPVLTASSFVNGADGQINSISPCSIAAIQAQGVATGGSGLPPVLGPLQYEVATDTVVFGTGTQAIAAPIFSVSNIGSEPQILLLVPCDVTPGSVPVTVTSGGGSATVNVNVLPASPGIFQTIQSDGVLRAVIERPDGSFASPTNPARRGETVTAFVTGLGPVSPAVIASDGNALPIWDTPSTVNGTVIVGINGAGVPVVTQQLSPDIIGVYYVQFVIPTNAPQNNSVVFSVGLQPVGSTQVYYSLAAGSKIPIE